MNESCTNTGECIASQLLTCLNDICDCSVDQYWDTNKICLRKKNENATCSRNVECFRNMNCFAGKCSCSSFQYHNFTALRCENQRFENGSCEINYHCRVDKGLVCSSSTCQCAPDTPIWSFFYHKCIARIKYGEINCYDNRECEIGQNLICYDTTTSSCNCPAPTLATMCDCYRAIGNESYWDGATCQPALNYGSFCTNATTTYMCQHMTQNTVCNLTGIRYYCQCPSLNYFDIVLQKCLPQQTVNGPCTVTIGCRVDKGLICSLPAGTCLCNSTYQFWSSTMGQCRDYTKYTQDCTSSQCDPHANLICNAGTNCSCPNVLTTNKCDCTRILTSETYWDGLKCQPAVAYLSPCANASTTYMCQTMKENTICALNGSDYMCQCALYFYFDTILGKCAPQKSNGLTCTATIECRTDKGLLCQLGLCACNLTTHYWSSTLSQCVAYKAYSEDCNTDLCNPFLLLVCNTGYNCSCPNFLGKNKCDCPRSLNNEYYWDGTKCVAAVAHGKACPIGEDYQCRTTTERTVCLSNVCTCWPNGGLKSGKCYWCEQNWFYIAATGNCYRVGTSGQADKDATSGTITSACADARAGVTPTLAEWSNGAVSSYFTTKTGGPIWVDLSKKGKDTFESSFGSWSIHEKDSIWGGDKDMKKAEDCAFYSGGQYYDSKCSSSYPMACVYEPI